MTPTNRTTAELREAIALIVQRFQNTDWLTASMQRQRAFEITDAILAFLPQPPALGGIVQEIDGRIEACGGDSSATGEAVDWLAASIIGHWPTLRANLNQEEWQDISTAPKDGTRILLTDGQDVSEGSWQEYDLSESEHHASTGAYLGEFTYDTVEEWMTWHGGFTKESPPAHWRPIPTPPQSKKEG